MKGLKLNYDFSDALTDELTVCGKYVDLSHILDLYHHDEKIASITLVIAETKMQVSAFSHSSDHISRNIAYRALMNTAISIHNEVIVERKYFYLDYWRYTDAASTLCGYNPMTYEYIAGPSPAVCSDIIFEVISVKFTNIHAHASWYKEKAKNSFTNYKFPTVDIITNNSILKNYEFNGCHPIPAFLVRNEWLSFVKKKIDGREIYGLITDEERIVSIIEISNSQCNKKQIVCHASYIDTDYQLSYHGRGCFRYLANEICRDHGELLTSNNPSFDEIIILRNIAYYAGGFMYTRIFNTIVNIYEKILDPNNLELSKHDVISITKWYSPSENPLNSRNLFMRMRNVDRDHHTVWYTYGVADEFNETGEINENFRNSYY